MAEFTYHRAEDGSMVRRFKQDGDTVGVSVHQDCEPIIERNKLIREVQQAGGSKGEIFRHVATIPVPVIEQAMREGWFEDDDAWKKWLNDPENRDFRSYEGQL